MKKFCSCLFPLIAILGANAQVPDSRDINGKTLLSNIGSDQKRIWLFPAKPVRGRNLNPTLVVLAATGALIAADAGTARYFRRTDAFHGFNATFTGRNTSLGMILAPVSFYAAGYLRGNSRMRRTALLAGEAVAGAEIVATVMKTIDRRARPAATAPNVTWAGGKSGWSNGSFPSGHTIAAFSIATVISRRYPNRRWVPYAAYGLAAVTGFSRITSSAHFPSDVFMGAALGYSISRFAVLRQ